jgi:hypothetical protein
MSGLIGFAPVYLNGLLAIFFVFILPGLAFVRAFNIPNFPQRWFVVFLSSLTANHLLVVLIATLHLDPLLVYRAVACALIAFLIFATVSGRVGSEALRYQSQSTVLPSDIAWLLLSLVVLCLAYFNVWKHGVPNIFEGGDLSASLSPDVTSAILEGKQPTELSLARIPKLLPLLWTDQRHLLG